MVIRRSNRVFALLLMTAVILACVPTLSPSSVPVPTFDPNSINTVIVETANAALTQTALFTTPSSTPTATPPFTPTSTETPTTIPTILIVLSTPTVPTPIPQVSAGPNDKFDCSVVSKSPNDGMGFSAGIEFTVNWQVANTGTEVWDSSSADVRYISGDRIHVQSAYDLDRDVPPNDQYTVTVKMKAPLESGDYTTVWAIGTNAAEYCRMSISIKV